MTEASTFAGDAVFGSFRSDMTLKRIVLRERNRMRENERGGGEGGGVAYRTDCVGFHLSAGSSPLIASSPGG